MLDVGKYGHWRKVGRVEKVVHFHCELFFIFIYLFIIIIIIILLIIGILIGFLRSSWGLSQGGLLSPYLFVIIMEAFNELIERVVVGG